MASKENRTVARVKAARTTTQEMARLYARRGADKMHSVGKEREDLLAILSFTRSNLSLAVRWYSASSSMPRYCLPVSSAAAQVDPLPANGSNTNSPGSEKLRINCANAVTGF